MIECFVSQREMLVRFPLAEAERFRVAPDYDFTVAPHPGHLLYHLHQWGGIAPARWRYHAARALAGWPYVTDTPEIKGLRHLSLSAVRAEREEN